MLTEEQREIRSLAREFARNEIRPFAAEWDASRELDREIFGKLGELGFMGMLIPEEFGGLDFDLLTYLLVLEELAWGDSSVALAVAIHSGPVPHILKEYGTREQKERYLPALATGETLGAFALSEAGAGSDAASLQTRYEGEGDGWTLNGAKKWVTNGDLGGLVILFARGGEEDGISAFLVEPGEPGYAVGRREVTMGLAASHTVEVKLENLRLPGDRLLGEEGAGFSYAMEALDLGRVGIAVQALGIARAAFEHAREYAGERVQFGNPLAKLQAIRFKLAGMNTRLNAARSLAYRAAESLEGRGDDEGPGPGSLAAMAKLVASESAVWITDEAIQIFGGYGYMRDYPVEKLLRDAKGTEIYEGTNEIMRLVIARDALGEDLP